MRPAPPARLPATARPARRPTDGRVAWIVAAALIVVLIVVGTWYALSRPSGRDSNAQRPGASPPAATPGHTTAAKSTAPRTTAPTGSDANPMRPAAMTRFVADYYRLVPRNTAEGWKRLGPNLKSIGYDSYTGFWGGIASVSVTGLAADPSSRSVTGTVTFVETSGNRSVERHRFDLITTAAGTGLLIDRDTLVRG
jgi:eukaryotic-like serine/threonine-protein kinase